jgi:peptidoglycan/xylan/chitin deacetylase (PgdA/CDA1 family)
VLAQLSPADAATRTLRGEGVSTGERAERRRWADRIEALRERRSVILGYHGVARSPFWHDLSLLLVRPSRFRAQIELLVNAGFKFLTVAELARLARGGEPPPGYAAISFDDGMRNNLTTALPILQEHDIPATVYVAINTIGGISPWVGAGGDNLMMDEDELRELAAAGWELGAHTMTHPDLSTLNYEACRYEIEQSKSALEAIVGGTVETFAYPFGRYGPAAVAAARDSGFIAAVSTGVGSWAPFELARAMISAGDPMLLVVLKLTDRYEPLLQIAPLKALRQLSKQIRKRVQ